MLTDQEVLKIFSWQPYRDDWPVDRNQKDHNIGSYYGSLINNLTKNTMFDTYYSEEGGLGNYLEFICYPKECITYEGNAILVCISLCAPIAAYGQITLNKRGKYIAFGGLFRAEEIGDIPDNSLASIVNEIKSILSQQNLSLLDKKFASKQLPDEIVEALRNDNHNNGNQYLHGIFQKTD